MTSADRQQQKYIDTSLGHTAVLASGSGPVVLLLHGLPWGSREWRDVITDLAPIRRCIALDQMGLGITEVKPGVICAINREYRCGLHTRFIRTFVHNAPPLPCALPHGGEGARRPPCCRLAPLGQG